MQLAQTTSTGVALYGKVGCLERETFTSTKLQLRVFTDAQCSQPYEDGESARKHANRGYLVDGQLISSKISFKPPFYSCLTCQPEQISGTFNKMNSNWYDDDYISGNGANDGDDAADDEEEAGDDFYKDDGYFDDGYMSANDDVAADDDAKYNQNSYNQNNYQNNNQNNGNNYYNGNNNQNNGNNYYNGDDYYNAADDDNNRQLIAAPVAALKVRFF